MTERRPAPRDYDARPERFRLARAVLHEHALRRDIRPDVAGKGREPDAVADVEVPLSVTKRGAVVFARRRPG